MPACPHKNKKSARDAADAVADAAYRLDREDPQWWRHIDEATLDLRSLHTDILGQLYGGYPTGLRRLQLPIDEVGQRGFNIAARHAFCPGRRAHFAELTTAWIAEIRIRKRSGTRTGRSGGA